MHIQFEMGKTNIYAGAIANLTDARYFAAWYVDWMGFDLESCLTTPENVHQFLEIKNWLDVDTFVGEFSGLGDIEQMKNILSHLDINAVKFGPFCPKYVLEEFRHMTIFKELIFENQTSLQNLRDNISAGEMYVNHYIIKGQSNCQVHYLDEAFPDKSFYLDLPNIAKFLKQGLLDSPLCEGIIVKGSDEEKVGVKDFSTLDEVYEELFD